MNDVVSNVAVAAGDGPPLTFRVPPAFFEYPLTDDPEALAEDLADLAAEVYPQGNDDLWFNFVVTSIPLVAEMVEAGVSYAGFCLLDIEGQRSTATVTATLLDDVPQAKKLTAKDLAEQLAAESPHSEVEVITLAAGEAAVRLTPEVRELPGEITDSRQPEALTTGKISVFFPLPDHGQIGLFDLSTACLDDWNLYSELFFNIVNTIEMAGNQPETPPGDYGSADGPATQPSPPPPEPELAQNLYWHSSRLLDALALHGRMDQGNHLAQITCQDCYAKGLRSVCAARHQWQIDEVDPTALPAALDRLRTHLTASGWSLQTDGPTEATEAAQHSSAALTATAPSSAPREAIGYGIRADGNSAERRLTAEVTSPCRRTVLAPAGSVFG
ncbi:hypothetical protein [Streptomyces sp. C10]|uniref:hypothetical protein n=1 Tax=Streptomyces sp. C10 TaxID=531941 RepID=UPI00397EB53B